MARKVKRWVVRENKNNGGWYWLLFGLKPKKPKGGWRQFPGDTPPISADGFEGFFPECYHLRPGGGPVEIEFKEP